MMARVVSIAFLAALVFVGNSYAQEVALFSDFDNGSLGRWTKTADREIELTLSDDSGGAFFFFRIENVKDQTLRFVVPRAPAQLFPEYSLPFISYDQIHWTALRKRWIEPNTKGGQSTRYTFEAAFAQPRAWIASTPPFNNDFLDQSLQQYLEHPHLRVETLCESPLKKKPIQLLHITDPAQADEPKSVVFILAREDALEPASSWAAWGMLRFLLSDGPYAAAIKRRMHFVLLPLFDADGVAQGASGHPFPETGGPVFWTEAWPETQVSFYEQRRLKQWLQQWKDAGKKIDYALRLHSDNWGRDVLRREQAREEMQPAQDLLFINLIEQKYLPWRANADRVQPDTRFSKVVYDLFPDAVTGMMQFEFLFDQTLLPQQPLYKTTEDIQVEGEMVVRAFGESLNIQASDPPPYLLSAQASPLSRGDRNAYAFQCVYRDLNNRPPEYVRVVVDEETYELAPADATQADYARGVLYVGFAGMKNRDNTHYFTASNGSSTTRSPQVGVWPGPYWLGGEK
ncbi:MAG: M14-type cytosolic carboxypeptidase [Candidatus Hinthialibacter antarcticus]|nr:M14-type cytosolic carboxypeptidase [Candidatus Hinthialibacter antarcticus]